MDLAGLAPVLAIERTSAGTISIVNVAFINADRIETTITLGAANLLDEAPPCVAIGGNYGPRSADPRGHRIYMGLRIRTN